MLIVFEIKKPFFSRIFNRSEVHFFPSDMKSKFAVICVFAAIISSAKSVFNEENDRMIGGYEAAPHEYPYLVLLEIDTGLSQPNRCSGVIIDVNWILTAAHCTQYAISIEITAGAHDVCQSEASQQKSIVGPTEVLQHPGFDPQTKANDVALLFVPAAFVLNTNVSLASLATTESATFSHMRTCGWGQTTAQIGTDSCVLLCADNLPILDDFTCKSVYVGSGHLPQEFECTDSSGPHGPCQGDSGGALVRMTNPYGPVEAITTYIDSQACGGLYPSVYVSIHYYLDWIRTATGIQVTTVRSAN